MYQNVSHVQWRYPIISLHDGPLIDVTAKTESGESPLSSDLKELTSLALTSQHVPGSSNARLLACGVRVIFCFDHHS